ncbi:hypothetical protein CKALI_02785 [Corynebacterium kalinowskii]|uniref:Uncharacterized protein n=2 Tax=Corynebacterium kalinowskii TaxID=2675216 RepID=A0A6B8VQZ4_9CORY|nr:hypothetical protein CKALI_02785 [Corynebacterium kalinowskii]
MTERADCSPLFEEFARDFKGREVEFDGVIAALAPAKNYKTRFNILVSQGDDANVFVGGPSFQFRDKNIVYDLKLKGDNIPDHLRAGDKVHIKAEVEKYEDNNGICLFLLTPTETKYR